MMEKTFWVLYTVCGVVNGDSSDKREICRMEEARNFSTQAECRAYAIDHLASAGSNFWACREQRPPNWPSVLEREMK